MEDCCNNFCNCNDVKEMNSELFLLKCPWYIDRKDCCDRHTKLYEKEKKHHEKTKIALEEAIKCCDRPSHVTEDDKCCCRQRDTLLKRTLMAKACCHHLAFETGEQSQCEDQRGPLQ